MTKTFFIIITICVLFIQDIYSQQKSSTTVKTVKIGLLIPNDKFIEARFSAEWAIRKANENGGINGRSVQLVTRSMEGPWGTGSKEAVNLVFEEKVWAILGSHDGRNAHLVEQVIAKTNIVLLSAWASDPTLSRAFVPWYFSCVPNDVQQADALIEEIYNKRGINKVAVVSNNDYDSKSALQFLLKAIKIAGKTDPLQLFYGTDKSFNILLDKIEEAGVNGIILLGNASTSKSFIQHLREKGMNQPVFGTLSLLGEDQFDNFNLSQDNNITMVTSGNWLGSKELTFQNEFQKKYGKMPGAVAAYAFDGMNVIIEAIRYSGLDREKMQESMSKTHYKGFTGTVQFDEKGNRVGAVEMIEINNEITVTGN